MRLKDHPAFKQAKKRMAKVVKRVQIEKAYEERDRQIKRRRRAG